MPKGDRFTDKQAAFVREYPKDWNATQAALRAGYARKGVESTASSLLRNPKVAAALAAVKNRAETKADISVARVLEEYKRLATFDPATMYDADGNLLHVKDMPEDTRRAIASVEVDEQRDYGNPSKDDDEDSDDGAPRRKRRPRDAFPVTGRTSKIRLWSKVQALADLGRHLKMFTDKVEHSHTFENVTDEQLEARYRELMERQVLTDGKK